MKAIFFPVYFILPFIVSAQNGTLDLTFNNAGFATTTVNINHSTGESVAIQSDGKIVVAGISASGATSSEFAVVRYNIDGSIDSTFSSDGIVRTFIGNSSAAHSVAIQSDGKIVVAGYAYNGLNKNIALACYNSDGSLDTSFNAGGITTLDLAVTNEEAFDVQVQSDNKILVAGTSFSGSNSNFIIARYDTSGLPDSTFDGDGVDTVNFGNLINNCYGMALQNDGKIVLCGNSGDSISLNFALTRIKPDGSMDSTFDLDGKIITPIGLQVDVANAVAIQNDGKIVAAGNYFNGNDDEFALVRYNIDGSLDTNFDVDGIVIAPLTPFNDQANSILVQSDGKIIVAGYSNLNGDDLFALTRFTGNGRYDSTFAYDGVVMGHFGPYASWAYDAALQSDGKIVIAGVSQKLNLVYEFLVFRFNNSVNTDVHSIEFNRDELIINPNPASESISISFSLNRSQRISFKVFDLNGNFVTSLSNDLFTTGENKLVWNPKVSAGMYILQVESRNFTEHFKIFIEK